MFKKGDIVFVKKGPHLTKGCEEFHEQMEEWKKIEYQFELRDCTYYGGQQCWFAPCADSWCVGESDIELVSFTLENE